MSDAQRRSYENFSGSYCIPFQPEPLDIPRIFGNENPLTVEIGFGMGIATAQIAEANPGINYLGFEVHRPGIGRLLWEIEERGLSNIRIVEYDAVEGIEKMIRPGEAAAFHIFFPDPWPKKRHHKRRLVTRPFTDLLAEKLSGNGYIYMVTDWVEYADWALAELSATPHLVNPYTGNGGFAPPQMWRPRTKFEQKGLAKGHEVREIYFKHISV
ncbi:tRNA (guanine-N(7)-)-methyltransferase [Spirochaetia bacterium]|nr:tRNA (guanine-N(7)-)-methyltransferase [Spirochaetia bacterium]